MNYLSFFLSFKYLCKRKIVLLSIASVAMSCALMIIVASLFTGFIDTLENSASRYMGDIVLNAPADLKISQYRKFTAALEENPSIEAATGVLSSQAGLLYLGPGNVRPVMIWGIELPKHDKITPLNQFLIKQKGTEDINFTSTDPSLPGGFVGIGVIAQPGEKTDEYDMELVNSFIEKKAFVTTGTSENKRPASMKFNITDVVFSGIHHFDKDFIYLPIEALCQKLYPSKGTLADMIQIRLADDADEEVALAIVRGIWDDFARNTLNWSGYAISQADIATSRSRQAPLVAEYRKQMGMLMLIFGIVSAGVVLLIFCIFYLIVMTKQKDIAIIKSCGLGSGSVAMLFITFGLVIGITGSGLGVAGGYYITKNINAIEQAVSTVFGLKLWKSSTYMFSIIPSRVDWPSVKWIVVSAIAAAVLGALIPAFVAAKVRCVKILRYE